MKTIKSVIVIMALCIACILAGAASASAEEIVQQGTYGDNIQWQIDDSGTLTISGEGSIPDCEGDEVTPWGNSPCGGPTDNYNRVVIEEGITRIGNSNFVFATLSEVRLPSTLTSIGTEAFYGITCVGDVDVIIPDSVTTIENGAFSCCEGDYFDTITVSNSIKEITYNVFTESARTIIMGKNVESIEKYALDSNRLRTLIFKNDYDYEDLVLTRYSDDNINIYRTCSGGVAFLEATKKKKNVSLPSTAGPYKVVTIAPYAFDGNNKMISISLPNTIKTIGSYAFYNCSKLATVKLGSGVKTIGNFAFYGCNSIESIKLPDTLETIGKRAFWDCYCLEKVTIPASIQMIEPYAFGKCIGLEYVSIGDTTSNTLNSAPVASPLKTQAKTIKIKSYAFSGCKGLKKVIIGKKVKTIGNSSFLKCSNLKTIKIKTTKLTSSRVGSNAFKGIKANAKIYVPKSKLKSYKSILRKKGVSKKATFVKL